MREIYLFNIRFIDADLSEIFNELESGGVMIAPSAPSLAIIDSDKTYYQSLIKSKFAIFDSGFLCIILMLIKGVKVKKISGLAFMREFLKRIKGFPPNSIFLVDPTIDDSYENNKLLRKYGYLLETTHQYIAPIYESGIIEDPLLLSKIEALRPKYLVLNLGGGVQERLADYLQKNLQCLNPSIICTGAAIAFLTEKQAKIPEIFDKLYLGWLVRCISNYKVFVPRYFYGLKLFLMLLNEKIIIKRSTN